MTAAIIFGLIWAAMIVARGTSIGEAMRRAMVVRPALIADRVRRVDMALGVIVVGLILLHAMAGADDPLRLLGLFAPEVAIWLATVELSIVIETAAALAAAITALCRSGSARTLLNLPAAVARVVASAGRSRSPRRRKDSPPANDDDHPAVVALAA